MSMEEKRISAEKMAAAFKALSPTEQQRLYYMMQGAALVSDSIHNKKPLHTTSDKE